MRSFTVLVIACCVIAASCFPKHAHLEKKASKLIHEAENDLDEVNEDDLQYENNQEEVAEYEDENVLEEKDEEPALESDNEAENDNEEDQKLEESDNAVAEDDDDGAELEEEDEERNVVQKRVASDIEKLQQALEESDLSDKVREQASDDLKKIQEDVVEMRHASEARRENLKEAVHKRIQAFRLMVDEHNSQKSREFEEEEIVSRVHGDVTNLEEAVESSHLSASEKKRAEKNLEAIARDAEEYSHAANSKAKQLFKEAINKRMQALHMMLEAETPAAEKPVDTTSVIADIHHIQSELKQTKMPIKAKKAVKENLTQMLKDAEEIPAAQAERRGRLEQALKLRSKALRQQLEEY